MTAPTTAPTPRQVTTPTRPSKAAPPHAAPMPAGTDPRHRGPSVRLAVVDRAARSVAHRRIGDLASLLDPGDLLVVNHAATVPASFPAESADGAPVEVRLVHALGPATWRAVLFGPGDWRQDTDLRPAPPELPVGARIAAAGTHATVAAVDPRSPRLVALRFDVSGPTLWQQLYRHGRPIQYAYQRDDLPLSAVQTVYATVPMAVEMPSAGRPLSWAVLADLRRAGVQVRGLAHAAGVSATGDPRIDRLLPLPEITDLPAETAAAVGRTRACGHRVVAAGTSVVRALEGRFLRAGRLAPGVASTDLVVDPSFELQVVDAVLAGVHPPGESHSQLLGAFAPEALLARAFAEATAEGYVRHEFGDATLVGAGFAATAG